MTESVPVLGRGIPLPAPIARHDILGEISLRPVAQDGRSMSRSSLLSGIGLVIYSLI